MNVNKNRLDALLDLALRDCEFCPLNETDFCQIDDENQSGEMNYFNCEEAMYAWLQEFDIAEAHIVNGKVIFAPEEIPFEPCYGTPCEIRNERGQTSMDCDECEYLFDCPYC